MMGGDFREMASCYAQEVVWWQLDDFDDGIVAFMAHVVN